MASIMRLRNNVMEKLLIVDVGLRLQTAFKFFSEAPATQATAVLAQHPYRVAV
jgi:hypothetical protein